MKPDSNDQDPVYDALILGAEAHGFFASDMGRYVVRRSKGEVDIATEQLIECDPENSKRIRELQCKIAIATAAIGWLSDALHDAYSAEMAARSVDDPDPNAGWV